MRLSRQLPCAAFGCGSSLVAASGGQGGIGGLRVPPTPSLDSLLTPLYRRRSAEGLEAAERCVLARRSGAGARGLCVALNSSVALRLLRRVLAPHLAALAAVWQPPAAKEGQGDCEFPLGPPWILLLPLETPPLRYGVGGGGAARSGVALCLAAKGWCGALRSAFAVRLARRRSSAAAKAAS